jgi:hypothetical protein
MTVRQNKLVSQLQSVMKRNGVTAITCTMYGDASIVDQEGEVILDFVEITVNPDHIELGGLSK